MESMPVSRSPHHRHHLQRRCRSLLVHEISIHSKRHQRNRCCQLQRLHHHHRHPRPSSPSTDPALHVNPVACALYSQPRRARRSPPLVRAATRSISLESPSNCCASNSKRDTFAVPPPCTTRRPRANHSRPLPTIGWSASVAHRARLHRTATPPPRLSTAYYCPSVVVVPSSSSSCWWCHHSTHAIAFAPPPLHHCRRPQRNRPVRADTGTLRCDRHRLRAPAGPGRRATAETDTRIRSGRTTATGRSCRDAAAANRCTGSACSRRIDGGWGNAGSAATGMWYRCRRHGWRATVLSGMWTCAAIARRLNCAHSGKERNLIRIEEKKQRPVYGDKRVPYISCV